MTTYKLILLFYALPLTLDIILFTLFKNTIKKHLDERTYFYLKITYLLPVLNIVQTISFAVFMILHILRFIVFIILEIRFTWYKFKAIRRMKRNIKIAGKLLEIALLKSLAESRKDTDNNG